MTLSCADGDAPRELPDGDPADHGMNPAVLAEARAYAFAEERHTQAVVVVHEGAVVAEWYAEDRDGDSLGASWSVAKSFVGALIGIALDRGDIPSIDTPMHTWFPQFLGTDKEAITLRDVLEMASGLEWSEGTQSGLMQDVVEMALQYRGSHVDIVLDNEVVHPPGTHFNYSSGDTMMLSHVLEQSTGMRADEYAQRHLFDPLGIDDARWWRDAAGHTLTYCCLDLTAREFARFGVMFLQGGVYDGRRVVSETWVAASTAPSRSSDRYGYHWWLGGGGEERLPANYRAVGVDGQSIYVIPSHDLVVVRLGRYSPPLEDDGVVDSLFGDIPSRGFLSYRGTIPPENWSDDDFLMPIVESLER